MYYIYENNGQYVAIKRNTGPTEDAICKLDNLSLLGKKLKIIEVEETDELTKETRLVKKAVVDLEKQALKEQKELEREQEMAVVNAVQGAMGFGQLLMTEFIVENVKLGITVDNMTETVLDAMSGVMNALQAGSLYLAIDRIKAIPVESKDAKYITDARLLTYVNKIEEYLGFQLSDEL